MLLDNGNLLIIGGSNLTNKCEIYNINKNEWITTGELNNKRFNFSITKMPDGRVVVFGGNDNTCEVYDPGNGKWTIIGSMIYSRSNHHSVFLNNDHILIFGGNELHWELYDIKLQQSVYSDIFPRNKMNQNANILPDGRVLSVGGISWIDDVDPLIFDVPWCEIYDPALTFIFKDNNEIVLKFKLAQNYPNPFNLMTNIKFEINETSKVTLKIFNILGKEITTLINKKLQSGKYNVNWNAQDIESGLYLYKLSTPNYSITKKMLIIK